MAIKVIEHGKKIFTTTCPGCGCKFEYELEDLEIDRSTCFTTYPVQHNRNVTCPDCGRKIYHDTVAAERKHSITYTVDTFQPKTLDCATCPNRPDPDHPTVGDSPCTFCSKMQPRVISGGSVGGAPKDITIK